MAFLYLLNVRHHHPVVSSTSMLLIEPQKYEYINKLFIDNIEGHDKYFFKMFGITIPSYSNTPSV